MAAAALHPHRRPPACARGSQPASGCTLLDDAPLAEDSVHTLGLSLCSPAVSSLPALSCLLPVTWRLALEWPSLIFTLPPGDICQHSRDICGHHTRGGAVQRPASCRTAPQRSAAPRVRTPGVEAAELQVRRLCPGLCSECRRAAEKERL